MQRLADMLGPSPYTGEQGETWALNHPLTHDDWNSAEDFRFLYAAGQFHVSDKDDYEQLAMNAGAGPDYDGPLALGKIHLDYGKAEFTVSTNLHSQGIERVLLEVCKKQGWQWGGMTDMAGQTLSDSKVSSIYFKEDGANIKLAHSPSSLDTIDGAIHINGKNAHVYPYCPSSLVEWANDTNRILYAGDNVIKRIEDSEQDSIYSPEWNNPEDHYLETDPKDDEAPPSGPFECESCHQIFPSMNSLVEHRKNDEDPWDDIQTRPPVIEYNDPDAAGADMDASSPPRFQERQNLVYGAMPLPAPVPWILDVKKDQIMVGTPGQTSDTYGAHFLPGQVIRGTYFPGGKLEIGALTDVSISVQHIMELWSYSQTHLPLKSIWIDVGNGAKPERVAKISEALWE